MPFWERVEEFFLAVPSWEDTSHGPEGKGRKLGLQGQARALALPHGWCLRGGDMLVAHISGSAAVQGQPGVGVRTPAVEPHCLGLHAAPPSTRQGTWGN